MYFIHKNKLKHTQKLSIINGYIFLNCLMHPVSVGKKTDERPIGVNFELYIKFLAIKICKMKVQKGRS
jgi:hypothetical protein